MSQLTRGMFGEGDVEVDLDAVKALFGFTSGNYVRDKILGDAHWYNKDGEWLGWGDLNLANLERLKTVLEEGEMLLILYGCDLPKERVHLDTTPAHLAKTAWNAVVKGSVCCIDREGYCAPDQQTLVMRCGILAKVLRPDELSRMLGVTAE